MALIACTSSALLTADPGPDAGAKPARRYVVAPLVVSSPSFGNGGGVSALYFYRPDGAGGAPPSTIALTAAYSDTDSYFLGLGTQSFRRDDNWRLNYGGVYGHIENELNVDGLSEVRFQTDVGAAFLRSSWRAWGEDDEDGFYVSLREAF